MTLITITKMDFHLLNFTLLLISITVKLSFVMVKYHHTMKLYVIDIDHYYVSNHQISFKVFFI